LLEGLNLIGYSNRIDASRIRKELGWSPRHTYAQAIEEMRAAWSNRTA
jgi:nucleoside-diphosphate-sugar epimerase